MMRWARAVLVLCLLGTAAEAAANTPGELQIGDTLRDATLQGLNGSPRKLSEFRGKPLIINMWASWCGPCRAEMASLERLAWLDPTGQFTVIGISTDDYPEQAMALLKKSNATISQFIDSKLQMENMLGATRLPLTVLIDADGRVLDKIYGAQEWDDPKSLRLIGKMFRIRVGTPPP
jgi:thiol-disulfide isomerase/thioredoxin